MLKTLNITAKMHFSQRPVTDFFVYYVELDTEEEYWEVELNFSLN